MLEEIKQEIRALGLRGNSFKPHKLIALLSAIRLLERNNYSEDKVYFDESFKRVFSDLFREFATETNSSCRPHTAFFHLHTSSFWSLVPAEGMNNELESATSIGGPGALCDLVDHALIADRLINVLRNPSEREDLVHFIINCLQEGRSLCVDSNQEFERLSELESATSFGNPFVGYLNSLQRAGGGNENALAESQACNVHFPSIHVVHPLAERIYAELRAPDGRHVILTGHAGDGKSTLALEVYKLLCGISSDTPLTTPPHAREDVGSVSIIKDLSERDKTKDDVLIDELSGESHRFLLVSNTGTLLDLIKQHPKPFADVPSILESRVLDAISAESGESSLKLGTVAFRVFNLARMDNLCLARQIFEKMLSPERWAVCAARPCRASCPIQINVDLIQRNQTRVLDRIFLAYRRMYEYGTRLTMRQYTEHLAYMITSGLDEADILAMQQKSPRPLVAEYLFYNRFFGDNGSLKDSAAFEMKAVQEIAEQGFGVRPCPGWEHRLWLRSGSSSLTLGLGIEMLDAEFEKMCRHGSRAAHVEGMTSDQAREQVRRMLYFLYDFQSAERNYLGQYLNSPTLLDWSAWQIPGAQLEFNEKTTLERKIYHVLQEHFTGVRLPEGSTQNDRRLYVTLSRRRSEVRQSAQVVLAQVDWGSSTSMKLVASHNAPGEVRQDLVLCGKDRIDGISLPLKVPFLDYVMMRHFGELGEVLEAAYLERLDRFKAQVHECATAAEDDRIMLVRLKTDHTFRRQHFSVNGDRLEVSDVL